MQKSILKISKANMKFTNVEELDSTYQKRSTNLVLVYLDFYFKKWKVSF